MYINQSNNLTYLNTISKEKIGSFVKRLYINPIQDGLFWGWSRMVGRRDKKASPLKSAFPLKSYNVETWHTYTLPKENPKNI